VTAAVGLQTGTLPGLDTVTSTALLGLAVAASVWLVRLLVRRRRGATDPGVRDARRLEEPAEGVAIAAGHGSAPADVAFEFPRPRAGRPTRPVRHAELYAVELGLVAGGLVAWLASVASVDPLVGGLLGSAMGAFGLWRVRSMALETIERETGLWLAATGVGLLAGWLCFF